MGVMREEIKNLSNEVSEKFLLADRWIEQIQQGSVIGSMTDADSIDELNSLYDSAFCLVNLFNERYSEESDLWWAKTLLKTIDEILKLFFIKCSSTTWLIEKEEG